MPFIGLLIGLIFQVIAYLIRPKPKQPAQNITDLKSPTSDAGHPIPVVFGSAVLKGPNCLYFGQVSHLQRDAILKNQGKK